MSTLSRKEMEDVIKSGGSVIYQGRHISRIDDLPKSADLAKGDPDKEAATMTDLQAQIAALQAEMAKLQPADDGKKTHFQAPGGKQPDKDAK